MFSTIPRIRTPVFLQKVISLLTSPVDTACNQNRKGNNMLSIFQHLFSSLGSEPKRNSCKDQWERYEIIKFLLLFFPFHSFNFYLRSGDQNGSVHFMFFKVFQHGQMLVRRPRRRVDQQHIQLPPRYIRHKLANQSCWKEQHSVQELKSKSCRITICPL